MVVMPAVVTTSPLVRCWLDENATVQMERVGRSVLAVPHEKWVSGLGSTMLVPVMNLDPLPTFLEQVS